MGSKQPSTYMKLVFTWPPCPMWMSLCKHREVLVAKMSDATPWLVGDMALNNMGKNIMFV